MQQFQKAGVKRFFKKLAMLLAVLLLLDAGLGRLLKHLYFKAKFNSITYVMHKDTSQIMVFGSSRAMHQYVPDIFEKKFKTSFYNCGREGCYLIYNLAAISAVAARHHPKHIILDIYPDELALQETNSLAMLLPYKDDPAVRPYINYNSKYEEYKLLSQVYPYNSLLGTILQGSLFPKKTNPEKADRGYGKIVGVLPYHPIPAFTHSPIIKERVDALDSFLANLSKKNIAITLVVSPIYFSFSANDQESLILKDLSKKYPNVRYFNYENDASLTRHELFYDDLHLNHTGALAFSEDLANKMLLAP